MTPRKAQNKPAGSRENHPVLSENSACFFGSNKGIVKLKP
jgi:hypothetical protein